MANGSLQKPKYQIIETTSTWSNIAANGGMAYVAIDNVPDGYVPISCSLEITSSMGNGAWQTVYNPTRFYETSGARGWMTRIRNNASTVLTVTGTVRTLCVAV